MNRLTLITFIVLSLGTNLCYAQWVKLPNPTLSGGTQQTPTLMAAHGSAVYCLAGSVYKSTNEGATWDSIATVAGASNMDANDSSLFIAKGNGLAGGDVGVFWYRNSLGYSSLSANISGYMLYPSLLRVVDSTIYVSWGSSASMSTNPSVYMSTNSGVSWTTLWLYTTYAPDVSAYGVAKVGTTIFIAVAGLGILRSINGGPFASVNTGIPNAVAPDIAWVDSTLIVIGGRSNFNGARSTNLGNTWQASPGGNALLTVGKTFFRLSADSVFESTDLGGTWTKLTGLPSGLKQMASSSTNLYLRTSTDVWRRPLSDVLPIQLASFEAATLTGNSVTLNWSTVSETNNYGFYVQRNGVDIKFIAGHGTTLEQHTYSYTDNTSPGHYQYRLKQVDLDGTATLSESVVIDVTAPSKFALNQNYPNPFNPSTQIAFSVAKEGPVTLRVYDVLGREVATLVNENRKAGEYTESFNGNQMASGMYVYVLRSSEGQLTGRMMMLK